MISKFQFQSLVLLLSLRESLHPTKIRQWQRNICVGFIPVECSPIGFCRFKSETFQFHHHSNGDSDFSKLNKRFQAQIWDPGGNVSDYKDGLRTRNRLWPDVNFVLHEEDTKRVVSETEINLLIRTGEKHSPLRKVTKQQWSGGDYYLWSEVFPRLKKYHHFIQLLSLSYKLRHGPFISCDWFFPFARINRNCSGARRLSKEYRGYLPKASNKLISTKHQDPESSPTTLNLYFQIKVMLMAFWSFSYKLIANKKCVKGGLSGLYLLPIRLPNDSRLTSTPSSKLFQFPVFAYNGCFPMFLYLVNYV